MVFKCPIVPSKPRAQLTPKAADTVLTKLPLGEPETISFGPRCPHLEVVR